jgi:uncharacterized protein involved in outer membrane biogenesis
MKLLKRLAIVLVLLVLLLAGGLAFGISRIDSIIKAAIEKGATHATGTQTTVSTVEIGLLSGEFSMSGLNLANPAGFSSPKFFGLGSAGVALSLPTLMQDTIELPRFAMDTIEVNLERRDGKTNFGTILDNLKKLQGESKPAPTSSPSAGAEKRLIIRDLELKNIIVKIDMAGGPQALSEFTRVTIPIDQIKLTDVGKTGSGVGGSGVTVAELSDIIIKAVLNAATDKGGPLIPADLLGDLNGRLAALGTDGLKMEVVAKAQGKVEEMGKKLADDAKKAVDDAAKKASDALKGLIPGKK